MQVSALEARALLDWYIAMGVDCAIGEISINRFASAKAPGLPPPAFPPQSDRERQAPLAATSSRPTQQAAAASDGGGDSIAARRLAAAAMTLDDLRQAMMGFEGCALKRTATQTVFGDGVAGAPLMLVGEAPGREEDLQGKPFIGRSGQLLDRILAAIGLDRTSVYIANVVPWRPPGNRTPTPQELAVCLPFIMRQIELAAPKCLVLLGGAAMTALNGSSQGIVKQRGQWQSLRIGDLTLPAMPTFHPAYLLRNPLSKRLMWRDFMEVKAALHKG